MGRALVSRRIAELEAHSRTRALADWETHDLARMIATEKTYDAMAGRGKKARATGEGAPA